LYYCKQKDPAEAGSVGEENNEKALLEPVNNNQHQGYLNSINPRNPKTR
jgi:hypothetical protein